MKVKTFAFLLFWAVLVVAGESVILNYENAPSTLSVPPQAWPSETKISAPAGRPSLLVFIHPHYPCSKATMEELMILMTHLNSKLSAHVIFLQPAQMKESWVKTSLWESAQKIPGVDLKIDAGGAESKNFHAFSSGETLLYSPEGKLLFYGGITESRGHIGENAGRNAIELIVTKGKADTNHTPVFGCTKFAMMVLTALIFTWGLEVFTAHLTRNVFVPLAGFSMISPMIAALIANDAEKQGLPKTLLAITVTTLIVFMPIKAIDLLILG